VAQYEFKFRFESDAELRADYTEEAIQRVIVPFVFPRAKSPVTFIGCTVVRVLHAKALTRSDTVSEL
jgi:hypothetical protein